MSLFQSHIRPIVRGKARCNVEFGAKISLSVTGEGFTFQDRLSYAPITKAKISRHKRWLNATAMVTTQK